MLKFAYLELPTHQYAHVVSNDSSKNVHGAILEGGLVVNVGGELIFPAKWALVSSNTEVGAHKLESIKLPFVSNPTATEA
jgi:hypothetical protein